MREIKNEDLRIEWWQDGYQKSLLRVTHLPTGIVIFRPRGMAEAMAALEHELLAYGQSQG